MSTRTPAASASPSANHYRESSYYGHGQYMPVNPGNMSSNTVCVRRPNSSKDRAPLSNMLWDLQTPHPSKSVGAISMGGSGNVMGGGGMNSIGFNKSLTLASSRPMSGGLALENHGLPAPGPAHHRYSFGVYDPSPSSSKLSKGYAK